MSVFITQNVSFVLTRPNLVMFRQRGSGYQLEMAKMQRTTFQAGIAWTGILAFAALGLFLLARGSAFGRPDMGRNSVERCGRMLSLRQKLATGLIDNAATRI